jgi:hypothetical protein
MCGEDRGKNTNERSPVSSLLRLKNVKMRDQGEPTERQKGERSRVSVWELRQLTVRVRD